MQHSVAFVQRDCFFFEGGEKRKVCRRQKQLTGAANPECKSMSRPVACNAQAGGKAKSSGLTVLSSFSYPEWRALNSIQAPAP